MAKYMERWKFRDTVCTTVYENNKGSITVKLGLGKWEKEYIVSSEFWDKRRVEEYRILIEYAHLDYLRER